MRSRYSAGQLKWLSTWYRHWRVSELTHRFNARFSEHKTNCAIKSALHNHGFFCDRPPGFANGERCIFSKEQSTFIRRNVIKYTHAEVALMLNKKYGTNFVEKQIHSFTANHGIKSGRTGNFPKGHKPWNRGTKGQGLTTRNGGTFSKGNVPKNLRSLGSERIDSKDGYVLIKVKERNPYTGEPTRFRAKHVVLWEKRHGPVPKGSVIMFKDGNIYNFKQKNLVCITKAENVRLNQFHYKEAPAVLKPSIFALVKLKARTGELIKSMDGIDFYV
jgi:hypothetical protein